MQRAGLLDSMATSVPTAMETSRVSTVSSELAHEMSGADISMDSDPSVDSDMENMTITDTHSHGHHNWNKTSESSYSGKSHTDSSNSGLSNSEGTSQATGEASTVSTVSFKVK